MKDTIENMPMMVCMLHWTGKNMKYDNYVCMHVHCVCTCMYVCMNVCMYMYVCMYECMYVCMYVYTYILCMHVHI